MQQSQTAPFKLEFIASNTNTTYHSISWRQNTLAIAASNLVYIALPHKILFSLSGLTGRINMLKWISLADFACVVACSSEGQLAFWKAPSDRITDHQEWSLASMTKIGKGSITTFDCRSAVNQGQVAAFDLAGRLTLWNFTFQDSALSIKLSTELEFGSRLQQSLQLVKLPDQGLLLLIGGYDKEIHVYSQQQVGSPLQYQASLSGHTNSVTDLAIYQTSQEPWNVLLASASQDHLIRVWRLEMLDPSILPSISENQDDFDQFRSKKSYILQPDFLKKGALRISMESVLQGHQDVVASIEWAFIQNSLILLSTSFDFTVALWKQDENGKTWGIQTRLGQVTGNKNAYFGACLHPSGKQIMAYTYNGALHHWKEQENMWRSLPTISGHFGPVSEVSIGPGFILSVSLDQTARIFSKIEKRWCELGRPQIHGYDLNSGALLNYNSNLCPYLVSAGDEKVLRIFKPPFSFLRNLNHLHFKNPEYLRYSQAHSNLQIQQQLPADAVAKPALGLLNKSIDPSANFNPDQFLSNTTEAKPSLELKVPVEDDLVNLTLWPEMKKLYGHVYEVFTVACSHDGVFIASACKAQATKRADIVIWKVKSPDHIEKQSSMMAHQLTVLDLQFSSDDQFLLSVGRDRRWALFKRNDDEYTLFALKKEAHSRLLWSCSWTSDDKYFATSSREKDHSIKIWVRPVEPILESESEIESEVSFGFEKLPATAVSFLPHSTLLVSGYENGAVCLWSFEAKVKKVSLLYRLHPYLAHAKQVSRIRCFIDSEDQENKVLIVTAAADHSVRLFSYSG